MSVSMKIRLTKGKVALVDAADFDFLNQWGWYAHNERGRWYAVRGAKPQLRMHRIILGMPEGYDSDHRDGNGLNNQRCNLRICTRSQNHMNRHRIRGRSIYKGVSWHKGGKKWEAHITLNGKHLHLGLFTSETEAAIAYNEAALKYHGEFARINKK